MTHLGHVYSDDWAEFERRWPAAVSFLRAASLANELAHLQARRGNLNDWEVKRLAELEQLERDCASLGGIRGDRRKVTKATRTGEATMTEVLAFEKLDEPGAFERYGPDVMQAEFAKSDAAVAELLPEGPEPFVPQVPTDCVMTCVIALTGLSEEPAGLVVKHRCENDHQAVLAVQLMASAWLKTMPGRTTLEDLRQGALDWEDVVALWPLIERHVERPKELVSVERVWPVIEKVGRLMAASGGL